ncbi:transcriptional regulator, MucR family [Rhizobiales bacterium GAS113]|nr:transcriptional regulator, MucR family [Rhizobiales bacterium GAS113]
MDEQQVSTAKTDLIALTGDIASSFVSGNKVASSDLPDLIRQIHETLTSVVNGKSEAKPESREPAVPIKSSVKPDYIVCLEDGKKFKSLKRHLRSSFNMSPEEYRKKWGLKHDYPMVAPAYAAQRSQLAKSMGLGNLRAQAKTAKAPVKKGPVAKGPVRKKAKAAKAK